MRVAIIGAGIAGLAAANALRDSGCSVTLFDKGRGLGGRTSTRRREGFAFDHGAQYFTVQDSRFENAVKHWQAAGVVAPWQGRIGVLDSSGFKVKPSNSVRYVGVPAMNALAKFMATGLFVQLQTQVARLEQGANGWRLFDTNNACLNEDSEFSTVLVTTPPVQAVPLLAPAPELAARAAQASMAPCWAVLAGFEPALALDFDGAFVNDSPLAWVARSSSKPGREGLDAWVLHADHGWSREYLELEADTIAQRLLDEFKRLSHIDQTPALLQAHRWRYALADNALDDGCLWDARLALGASGDWCAGPRLEGAFLSGLAAAEKVINAKATLS